MGSAHTGFIFKEAVWSIFSYYWLKDDYGKMRLERSGVSVVELLVVIIIMIILGAMAVIRFGAYDSLKLDAAAQKIASDLRYVQQLSMMMDTDKYYVVHFKVSSETYELRRWGGGSNYCETNWPPINDPFEQQAFLVDFNKGVYSGVDIYSASFYNNGPVLGFQGCLGRPKNAQYAYSTCYYYMVSNSTLFSEGTVQLSYRGRTKTVYITPAGKVGIR